MEEAFFIVSSSFRVVRLGYEINTHKGLVSFQSTFLGFQYFLLSIL